MCVCVRESCWPFPPTPPCTQGTLPGQGVERMSREAMMQGGEFVKDRFYTIAHPSGEPPTIEWILEMAESAVMR